MGKSRFGVALSEEARADQLVLKLLSSSEKRRLILILLLMIFGAVLEVLSLGMVIPIIGLLTKPDYIETVKFPFSLFEGVSQSDVIIIAMVALVLLFVFKTCFLIWKIWLQRGFSNEITARISRDLFDVYLHLPYSYHLENNSSTLIRNAQSSNSLMMGIIDPLLLVISESLVTFGLLVLILWLEPVGSLVTILSFGVFALIFQKVTSRKVRKWGEADNFHKGMLVQHLQQGFGGVKDVKVLSRENYFVDEYDFHLQSSSNVLRRYETVSTLPRFGLELLTIIGLAILVSIMIATGRGVDQIMPIIGLFGATAFRLLPSAHQFLTSLQSINRNMPILKILVKDLNLGVSDKSDVVSSSEFFSKLEMRNVHFGYSSLNFDALSDVSLSIHRGEAVGFVGQSGAGKSTLVDSLLGLLKPRQGELFVNGSDIANRLQWWRSRVGYVPQTIFLTDDTLRKNVAFGLPEEEINDVSVRNAIRLAQLDEFIDSLPEGMNSMVGERGVRLSGGQRQRIGIARALYNNPEVLVLDEATSSLDTETEHGVMQAVQALQGDKTVIIVAHRLSTVEYCDRLYRLDAGRIVDEGTFDEVMNRSQS
jgi:ABC-type multidrug transport system fused ATPase/permease subunit